MVSLSPIRRTIIVTITVCFTIFKVTAGNQHTASYIPLARILLLEFIVQGPVEDTGTWVGNPMPR